MKNLVWILVFSLFAWTACEEMEVDPTLDDPAAAMAKGKPVAGNYFISSDWDGNVLSFTVDQSMAQAASHILIQIIDCEGNYIDHVVSSSIPIDFTTGNGTGCFFDNEGAFFKFDALDMYEADGTFTLWMTFSEGVQIESAAILIKSARNCFPFDLNITPNCEDDPDGEGHETAYAFGEEYATCFLDLDLNNDGRGDFNRWGWTNYISEGTYEWPIYAGAGQCDTDKGTLVGYLSVDYALGTLVATYTILDEYALDKTTHMYVGTGAVPQDCDKKCVGTVAPGQYTDMGDYKYTYTFTDLSGPVYLIAHAEVAL